MQVLAFDKAQVGNKQKRVVAGGFAGWVMSAVSNLRAGTVKASERQMKLVERLAVGPKKELLLVNCGGELFLVGMGADSVQTIVRVPAAGSHLVAKEEPAR